MNASAKKRGRPKIEWKPFEDELWRRLTTGAALETVQEEAKYLAKWAKDEGICSSDGKYLQFERIRNRINKRHNKAAGYKQARNFHIQNLIHANKQSD